MLCIAPQLTSTVYFQYTHCTVNLSHTPSIQKYEKALVHHVFLIHGDICYCQDMTIVLVVWWKL